MLSGFHALFFEIIQVIPENNQGRRNSVDHDTNKQTLGFFDLNPLQTDTHTERCWLPMVLTEDSRIRAPSSMQGVNWSTPMVHKPIARWGMYTLDWDTNRQPPS